MKTVVDTLGVARSNLAVQAAPTTLRQRRGRRPQPDAALLAEVKQIIAALPTYGYRRVHAVLRRRREQTGQRAVNVKRVYRVMMAHGLLLNGMAEAFVKIFKRDYARVRPRPDAATVTAQLLTGSSITNRPPVGRSAIDHHASSAAW